MITLVMSGFFDIDERRIAMSAKGDDLERITWLVDFELFRPQLEAAVPRANRTKGGRPAFDHVLMFKILFLQAMHSLSDERCEYLIKVRLSFMRFLGLGGPQAAQNGRGEGGDQGRGRSRIQEGQARQMRAKRIAMSAGR